MPHVFCSYSVVFKYINQFVFLHAQKFPFYFQCWMQYWMTVALQAVFQLSSEILNFFASFSLWRVYSSPTHFTLERCVLWWSYIKKEKKCKHTCGFNTCSIHNKLNPQKVNGSLPSTFITILSRSRVKTCFYSAFSLVLIWY